MILGNFFFKDKCHMSERDREKMYQRNIFRLGLQKTKRKKGPKRSKLFQR